MSNATQATQPQVISRQAAHIAGKRRFFTGTPCNNGHVAERYVSNGACTACLVGRYKFRQNPYSHELAPYVPGKLWVPRSYTPDELQALEVYLQRCIVEHVKHTGKLTNELDEAFGLQLEAKV